MEHIQHNAASMTLLQELLTALVQAYMALCSISTPPVQILVPERSAPCRELSLPGSSRGLPLHRYDPYVLPQNVPQHVLRFVPKTPPPLQPGQEARTLSPSPEGKARGKGKGKDEDAGKGKDKGKDKDAGKGQDKGKDKDDGGVNVKLEPGDM